MGKYPENVYRPRRNRQGMRLVPLNSSIFGTGGVTVADSATTTLPIESPRLQGFIDSVSVRADVAAISASGTVLMTVKKWDAAAAAAVTLSAALSLEAAGITAVKNAIDMPLLTTLTEAQRTKLPADTLYLEIVANDAIETAPVNGQVTVILSQTR